MSPRCSVAVVGRCFRGKKWKGAGGFGKVTLMLQHVWAQCSLFACLCESELHHIFLFVSYTCVPQHRLFERLVCMSQSESRVWYYNIWRVSDSNVTLTQRNHLQRVLCSSFDTLAHFKVMSVHSGLFGNLIILAI